MSDTEEDVQDHELVNELVPPDTQEDDASIEARARNMGWVPENSFRGPPGKWRPAKEFLEHGEKNLPVLRERFRNMEGELITTRNDLREAKTRIAEMSDVLIELRDMSKTAEERAYQRAVRDVEERQRQAVANADIMAYETLARERAEIEASRPQVKKSNDTSTPAATDQRQVNPAAPVVDPEVEQWVSRNPWFNNVAYLRAYAIETDGSLMSSRPHLSQAERLAEVRRIVAQKFPEHFDNPRRPAAAPVATPVNDSPRPRSGSKTFDDLPPEAKAACLKFEKTIPGYKREDYIKMYFSGDEQ